MGRLYNGMTFHQVCGRAAEFGRRNGWCQYAWVNQDGNRCLVALINIVLGRNPKDELPREIRLGLHQHLMSSSASYQRHIAVLRKTGSFMSSAPSNMILFRWNDLEETTASEVLGALEAIQRQERSASVTDWDREFAELMESSPATNRELVAA